MKKLLLFLFMLLPVEVSADAVEINGIWYNLIFKAKKAEVTSGIDKYVGEIIIPESVVYEGITYSVTSIEENAFYECEGITLLTIPNSVTSIPKYAFFGCEGLSSFTIPNGVLSIGERAFMNCTNLTCVDIPNTVRTIDIWAFAGCRNLASVSISNSVTTIKEYSFAWCESLNSIDIPNSVTSIEGWAFSDCSKLTTLNIPSSVTTIGAGAFSECNSLNSVNIDDIASWCRIDFNNLYSNPLFYAQHLYINGIEVNDLVIPDDVTNINSNVFYNCSSLSSVTFPNSLISIDSYAFSNCIDLKYVEIPNSVKSIGVNAFSGCSDLEKLKIGSGVTNIEVNAFAFCKNLTEVTCFSPNVPTTDVNAFKNSMIEYATLNVLRSANDYRNTKPWSDFGYIVSFTPVYKLTYMLDGEEYKTYEYEEGESITPEPDPTKEGYFFSGWSEIPETMPANEVIVTGRFLLKPVCATPTITLLPNGKVKVECATEGATCVTNITATNAEPITDGEISLSNPLVVYTITSYATKESYDDSEIATSTFRYEKKEGDINDDGNLNISDVVQLVNMILGN